MGTQIRAGRTAKCGPPALILFYRNSAIREVKIPHTQMAMELMAPWSSPISRALVVPRA